MRRNKEHLPHLSAWYHLSTLADSVEVKDQTSKLLDLFQRLMTGVPKMCTRGRDARTKTTKKTEGKVEEQVFSPLIIK